MSQDKKLQRSANRMVFGVCGGLADYLNIDPVLVRLAFVLLTMADGVGLLIYLVLAVVMPDGASQPAAPRVEKTGEPEFEPLGSRDLG